MPYVHNLESAWKIIRPQVKKGNGGHGNHAIEKVDLSMVKITATDSMAEGKKPSACGLLG